MKKAKRRKENKFLELYKKGIRKNEIVIYAIALMLVTAGYFNYSTNLDKDSTTVSSNEIIDNEIIEISKNQKDDFENINETEEKIENEENKKDEDIGDAKLVNSNSVVIEQEDNNIDENINEENNSNRKEYEEDYFVKTKLERDTNYADMISTYTKILEDNSISETQKSIAMQEITKINETKNAISICENLLSTKGFAEYVVLVNSDSVNVIVKVEGGLEKNKVAQIQNIVSRELKSEIENIHITEK